MSTDPPAPNPGVLRHRRLALAANMLEREGRPIIAADIRSVLAANTAQAARLVRIAEICRLGIEGKDALEERDAIRAIAEES